MLDAAAPMRCRVDYAKILVDRAGYVAGAPAADAASRDLQDMSLDELQALVRDLSVQRAAAATDVTPAPIENEIEGASPHEDDTPPQSH